MALIARAPWTSQPQLPTLGAPEFRSVTTLASHNFANTGTTRNARKSGIVHTSNGSSTYLSKSIAVRSGQALFLAAYFRRTAADTAGNAVYSFGENAATGSLLGLRTGAGGFAGSMGITYRAAALGPFFEVGTNTVNTIPVGTDVCVVGVVPSLSSADAYLYINGIKYNTVLAAGSPSGSALFSFETIGAVRRDTVASFYPADVYAVGHGGAIAEHRARHLSLNPWEMFAPQQRRIWVPGDTVVTIARPGSDITTTGWTGTPDNVTKYANIDEASASDTDYITSPQITGVVAPITFGIKDQNGNPNTLPAGTWSVSVRANFTEGTTAPQFRIALLDSAGVSVGNSAYQLVTASYATYTLPVTTTGIAARIRIEFP